MADTGTVDARSPRPAAIARASAMSPIGATGAIEVAMASLAVAEGWVPGTVNLDAPEPELAALLPNLVRDGREGSYDRILSTSFGFGGLNAALVMGSAREA